MNSFYSIIRFVNNQWSNENIAVGLLAVSSEKIFFKVSDHKINFVKNLNPEPFKLLKFSLDQLKIFNQLEETKLREQHQLLILKENHPINHSFVEQLHHYNSGILQFSSPEKINKIFNHEIFDDYFKKIIDSSPEKESNKSKASEFQKAIKKNLHKPLKGIVDVDYPLKKKSLPDLYFDYRLENIGVNGSIIASASVDFNQERIDVIEKNLAEFELVVDRLIKFADSKGLGSDHEFYLIADSYNGKQVSNQEIDTMLKGGVEGKFRRISSDELEVVVKQVEKRNSRKFSEFI